MAKAKLDNEMIATVAGDITVFNYDGETREYLSSSVEYLAVGVGIPANSCIDAPGEAKAGSAICRTADFTGWEYVADHRGETVYDTETGQPVEINRLGNYPENVTVIEPMTPYDRWNGSKWVVDKDAQKRADLEKAEQQKSALLADAKSTISLWQTELQLGIISDEDKNSLIVWISYIKAVQAVDTSKAPKIKWPEKPKLK